MSAYRLFDNETQQYIGADADAIPSLLASGKAKLAHDEKIRVVAPGGEEFDADATADFNQLVADGFKLESFGEKQYRQKLEWAKENPAAAAATGALRGATFGLSDVAAASIGQAETFAALEEANPKASFVGNVAGAVGSSVLAPGGGLVSRVSQLGNKAAASVGRVVGADLGAPLVFDGVGSVGKQLLQRAAARGAGSAVEGALYGGAQTVTEAALGDPKEAAENLLANMGMGALFGGAIGGAVGAPFDLIGGKVRNKIGGMAAKAVNEGIETAMDVNQAIRGLEQPKLSQLFSQWGDEGAAANRQKVVGFMANPDEAKTTFVDGMQKLFNAGNDLSYGLTGRTNDKLIADLGQVQGATAKKATLHAIDAMTSARKQIKEVLADPVEAALHDQGFLKKMGAITKKYQDEMSSIFRDKDRSVADAFETMLKYRREVDSFGKKFFPKSDAMLAGAERNTKRWFDEFRGGLADTLADSKAFGPLAERNKEINAYVSRFLKAQEYFKKKFGTKMMDESGREIIGIDPTKMGSFLNDQKATRNALKSDIFQRYVKTMDDLVKFSETKGYLKDLTPETQDLIKNVNAQKESLQSIRESLQGLNMIQSYTGKSLGGMLMGGMFGSVFGGPMGSAAGAATGWALNNPVTVLRVLTGMEKAIMGNKNRMAENANRFFSGKPLSWQNGAKPTRIAALSVLGQTIGAITRDPVDRTTTTPKTAEQIMNQLVQVTPEQIQAGIEKQLAHVTTQAPMVAASLAQTSTHGIEFLKSKVPQTALQPSMFQSPKIKPSPLQVSKFERYVQGVMSPTETLELIQKGQLMPEHVEAIQVVYPSLYKQAQQAVTLATQFHKNELSYSKKLSLARLFGVATVPALDPKMMAQLQTAFVLPIENEGGKVTGSGTMLADNTATATQQVMMR